MLFKLAEYFWFLGLLTVKQMSLRTRRYVAANICLAVVILAVVSLGLLITSLARPALYIAGLLGFVMIGRVAAGILTADILQELLPEAKKEEIITKRYVGMAAGVILVTISPLLIPILWPEQVQADRSNYTLALLCWMLLGYGALSTASSAKGEKKK